MIFVMDMQCLLWGRNWIF